MNGRTDGQKEAMTAMQHVLHLWTHGTWSNVSQ